MQTFEALSWTCFTDELWSTVCVQKSSVSQNSARHTAFRSKLRPSSKQEPRHPSPGVVKSTKSFKIGKWFNAAIIIVKFSLSSHHSHGLLVRTNFISPIGATVQHATTKWSLPALTARMQTSTNNRDNGPEATNACCFKLHGPSRRRRLNRSSTKKTEKSKICFGSFTDWDKVISTIEFK